MRWIPPERYYEAANPKKDVIAKLQKDASRLNGSCPEILLSFVGDVYQPAEMELGLTRQAVETLIEADLPFTILTKGGTRAVRDFDLLESYPKARFGTTLVFTKQQDGDQWEPYAASIIDRLQAVREAKKRSIPTWVSLEPVIDPVQALSLISNFHDIVDHWKVGKINHNKKLEGEVDWIGFRRDVTDLLDSLGADYYLKKSLTEL
jgi:DNA repair photolyase